MYQKNNWVLSLNKSHKLQQIHKVKKNNLKIIIQLLLDYKQFLNKNPITIRLKISKKSNKKNQILELNYRKIVVKLCLSTINCNKVIRI